MDRLAKGFFSCDESKFQAESKFFFSVKGNIFVKGFEANSGSKILRNFYPPYSAEFVQFLEGMGGTCLGTTILDEFAVGSSTLNTFCPVDSDTVGGSSGGAALAVSSLSQQIKHISFGTSTGGSVNYPSALANLWSFTPSFGRISKEGVVEYSHSLDKIAGISKDPLLLRHIMAELIQFDWVKDNMVSKSPLQEIKGRITYFLDIQELPFSQEFKEEYALRINAFEGEKKGFSLAGFPDFVKIYHDITAAELYSNTLKYDSKYYEVANLKYEDRTNIVRKRFMPATLEKINLGSFTIKEYEQNLSKWDSFKEQIRGALPDLKFLILPALPDFLGGKIDHNFADYLHIMPNLLSFPTLILPDLDRKEGGIPLQICSETNTDLSLMEYFFK